MTTKAQQTDSSAPAGQSGDAGSANQSTPADGQDKDSGGTSVLTDAAGDSDKNTDAGGQGPGQATDQSGSDDGNEGELEIAVPEGVKVDQPMLDAFTAFAKENKLTSESASAAVKWFADQQTAQVKAMADAHEKQGDEWLKSLKADPDFGGNHWESTVADSQRAMVQFDGTDGALRALLSEYGLGNHPALVKAFARIGRAIKEDNSGRSTGGGGKPVSKEEKLAKMYPKSQNRAQG
jgi:hypothetical protein